MRAHLRRGLRLDLAMTTASLGARVPALSIHRDQPGKSTIPNQGARKRALRGRGRRRHAQPDSGEARRRPARQSAPSTMATTDLVGDREIGGVDHRRFRHARDAAGRASSPRTGRSIRWYMQPRRHVGGVRPGGSTSTIGQGSRRGRGAQAEHRVAVLGQNGQIDSSWFASTPSMELEFLMSVSTNSLRPMMELLDLVGRAAAVGAAAQDALPRRTAGERRRPPAAPAGRPGEVSEAISSSWSRGGPVPCGPGATQVDLGPARLFLVELPPSARLGHGAAPGRSLEISMLPGDHGCAAPGRESPSRSDAGHPDAARRRRTPASPAPFRRSLPNSTPRPISSSTRATIWARGRDGAGRATTLAFVTAGCVHQRPTDSDGVCSDQRRRGVSLVDADRSRVDHHKHDSASASSPRPRRYGSTSSPAAAPQA